MPGHRVGTEQEQVAQHDAGQQQPTDRPAPTVGVQRRVRGHAAVLCVVPGVSRTLRKKEADSSTGCYLSAQPPAPSWRESSCV